MPDFILLKRRDLMKYRIIIGENNDDFVYADNLEKDIAEEKLRILKPTLKCRAYAFVEPCE
jgi:hypothetical protein